MDQSSQVTYALVVKKDCPTCTLIEPVIQTLSHRAGGQLTVYVQDDPSFPADISAVVDDTALEFSYKNQIEIVPTLIRSKDGKELDRIYGWDKQQWREFTDIENLGDELPDFKPGCGSKTQDPGMEEKLQLRFGDAKLKSRQIDIAADDVMEACYDHGWTDGLPVVPPTPVRVLRMLAGTSRDGSEQIGLIPPDRAPCSIEKVAINAVMAGCKPEYFPVVLAVVEAALQDKFCLHGLLCTTYFSSPVIIVNGPVSRKIGMNSGGNALGQGNRANATIGRALQLLVRNVGGGLPGGIDRATLGNPGKYTFCFAEDESNAQWPSLAMDYGYSRDESIVHLFAGDGIQPIMDQQSRTPESLAKSLALALKSVAHPKIYMLADAVLVISPEHRRVFMQGGWTKEQVKERILENLQTPGKDLIRGAQDILEGMPAQFESKTIGKFRKGGLHIVSAGGTAGLFSAIISGWVASGERGSQLVSTEVSS